ncbi:MAG: hypothetical protein WC763_06185 [Candidatus Paceibacterota bacterium]
MARSSCAMEVTTVVCTTVLILAYMLRITLVPSPPTTTTPSPPTTTPMLITTGNCSAVGILPAAEVNSTTSFNQVLLVCSTMPGINGTTVSLDGAVSACIPAEPLNLYEHQKIMFVFIQWTLIIGAIVVAVVLGGLNVVERYKRCGGH